MARVDKLVQKIKDNPKNIRFREIQRVLLNAGFKMRQSKRGTSHYVFRHPDLELNVVIVTHGRNDIVPDYQIRDALEALERLEEGN
jgi:predicted RNA binding protein YcfA (HicA-like mRNA interferase family)